VLRQPSFVVGAVGGPGNASRACVFVFSSAKMTHVALAQIARNNASPHRHIFASNERLNFNQSF
jgi:hypothetical protein